MPRLSATSKTASKSTTKTKSVTSSTPANPAASAQKASAKTPAKATRAASAATDTGKKAPARKATATSPHQSAYTGVSNEERYRYVAEAAYFIAERDGFSADPVDYWLQAECEVERMITKR